MLINEEIIYLNNIIKNSKIPNSNNSYDDKNIDNDINICKKIVNTENTDNNKYNNLITYNINKNNNYNIINSNINHFENLNINQENKKEDKFLENAPESKKDKVNEKLVQNESNKEKY